jgi:DNA replication and repair protein RecF
MFIRKVSIEDFRNFAQASLAFTEGINCILGPNAAGKTNFIEAIYYLSLARSFKKAKDADLIKDGAKQAGLLVEYESVTDGKHVLEGTITPQGKIISLDGEKQSSVLKIVGKLLCVVYDPSSVQLFKDEPAERRGLMDATLSLMSQKYIYALIRQKKLLKERNVALSQSYDEDVIDVLTNELVTVSYRIYFDRQKFVAEANKTITEIYDELFMSEEKVSLKYVTNVPRIEDEGQFVSELKKYYASVKTEERIRKMTLIGNQKDDLIAYLDAKPVYAFASQGQNRLVSLALKLAVFKILEERFNEKPVLLLDDVMSDLDGKRRVALINYLKNNLGQVFITSAETIDGMEGCASYMIQDGKAERR